MRTYTFLIGTGESGQRLDQYLVRRLPAAVSRVLIQRGIRAGDVTVAGAAAKPNRKLRSGEAVVARFAFLRPPSQGLPVRAEPIPLEVAYEDETVLVVNKPPGLVTHPAPGHWNGTLVNAIVWHLQQAAGGKPPAARSGPGLDASRPLVRAGIIHRLDKDTSGLLLAAKTDAAHAALSRQLKARDIRRQYLALVDGALPLDQGTINVPIGRHVTHRKEMTVRHLGGRTAVTHYRVLRRVPAVGDRPSYSVVDVSLETGRTHQIRVHVAHLGHPVLGDVTYGRHPASYWQGIGVPRQMLHAYRLSFEHPRTGRMIAVTAPLPQDFASWVAEASLTRISGVL